MDWVPYLTVVIYVATLATVVLACFSYLAFRVRDRRRPARAEGQLPFFRRYAPDPPESDSASEADDSA